MTNVKKWIYYPIITDKESAENAVDQSIFGTFGVIKKYMTENNSNNLAVPEIEGAVGTIDIKVLEYLFAFANIEIKIVMDKKEQLRNYGRQTSQTPSNVEKTNVTKRSKSPKLDALVIEMGDMKYADVAKTARSSISPQSLRPASDNK